MIGVGMLAAAARRLRGWRLCRVSEERMTAHGTHYRWDFAVYVKVLGAGTWAAGYDAVAGTRDVAGGGGHGGKAREGGVNLALLVQRIVGLYATLNQTVIV